MNHPQPQSLPPTVAWLGYGGLLPFIALALAAVLDSAPHYAWGAALRTYGAVILAFVGALHWGFAMALAGLDARQRQRRFVWSVVPSLLAWPALLVPPWLALGLLVVGFLAHYAQDLRLARMASLPTWYLPLRLRLTTVACVCLLLGGWPA
nr:DUF3429 domain-containing protein [uncultured Albidiferax sp.]